LSSPSRRAPEDDPYARWIQDYDRLSDEDRRQIREHIDGFARKPLISVVMPAYDTPTALLREAIASVQTQLYPFWELCIADDASPSPQVAQVLREAAAADPRIRWVRREQNGHISAATNTALALASGEFVALMDHDDLLPETALYRVAAEIEAHPDLDMIYSDEDRVDGRGQRSHPYFKPGWSPELLSGHNMICHLGVYRRTMIESVGGLRLGFEGSQDWDLALRVTATTTPDRIRHIPAILYHWRRSAEQSTFSQAFLDRCKAAGRQAVEDWIASEGDAGAVQPSRLVADWQRVVYDLPSPAPRVALIVADPDQSAPLDWFLSNLLDRTDWPQDKLEFVIANGGAPPADLLGANWMDSEPKAYAISVAGPTNRAALINLALRESQGEVVVILDGGLRPQERDWLANLVRLAMRRGVGLVGAKLLDRHGSLHHAGYFLNAKGEVETVSRPVPADDPGYFGQLGLARSASAISGSCMAAQREVLEVVGDFDESLSILSEVDFCLRLRSRGYRVVWTPDAMLAYVDEAPPVAPSSAAETAIIHHRWGKLLTEDPYNNPNLRLMQEGGSAKATVPTKPWKRSARHPEAFCA
jgi:cellulose synthase/poly-beta-1,6-N-acetylglucosamine synthase-like glycosyltransferase